MNSNNKVYINPNFNMPSRNHLTTVNNKMHVNPEYSQQVLQNKTKIYVNPIFIHSKSNLQHCLNAHEEAYISVKSNKDLINANPTPPINGLTYNTSQSSMSTSRYSLVRHNTTQTSKSRENFVPKATMQINKYKSVAISNYKKSLDTAQILQKKINKPSCSIVNMKKLEMSNNDNNKSNAASSKHQRNNMITPTSMKMIQRSKSKFVYRKISHDSSRTVVKSCDEKFKVMKRNLKKNNIPCPLFKKYGKCLRSLHGKCEFLHDKKHVSVCRKFIKGVCHDSNCLLSHDITTKKMPTCHFYLNGMCTRDSCPYLHVKLNDKSKVCQEFLKGYCENGDQCLNQHITTPKIIKKRELNRQSLHSIKRSKIKSSASENVKNYTQNKTEKNTINDIDTSSCIDNRYYNEVITAENINDATGEIKPSRCKLGTLPSFIKF